MSLTRDHELKTPLIKKNNNTLLFFKQMPDDIVQGAISFLDKNDMRNLKKTAKEFYGNVNLNYRNKWSSSCFNYMEFGIRNISDCTLSIVPRTGSANCVESSIIGCFCTPCLVTCFGLSVTWGTPFCLLGTSGYIIGGIVDGCKYIKDQTNPVDLIELNYAPQRQLMR